MLIDTHAHLQDNRFADDIGGVLERARQAGVETVIVPGTTAADSAQAAELAAAYSMIYAAAGLHPCEIHTNWREDVCLIRDICSGEQKVAAIGEAGLDLHWRTDNIAEQTAVLEAMLSLALEAQRPIILHSRGAEQQLLDVAKSFFRHGGTNSGVLHCYQGALETLEHFMELGFYVSFAGNVTFPKAEHLRNLARLAPDDHILLETDSPYLAPQLFRGKRCEPAHIAATAACVAACRQLDVEALAALCSRNAVRLFDLA